MKLSPFWLAAGVMLATAAQAQAPAATPAAPQAAAPNVSMCTGCHLIPGYRMAYPQVYHVPMIGGQEQKYLENALLEYKRGTRNNETMHGIARGLDDAEIKALAAYFAGLGKGAAR